MSKLYLCFLCNENNTIVKLFCRHNIDKVLHAFVMEMQPIPRSGPNSTKEHCKSKEIQILANLTSKNLSLYQFVISGICCCRTIEKRSDMSYNYDESVVFI